MRMHAVTNISQAQVSESTSTPAQKISDLLRQTLPQRNSLNVGVLLISVYFIFEFGSVQMLFPLVGQMRLPLISSVLALLTAFYSIIARRVEWRSRITRRFTVLCGFIIIYALLSTRLPETRTELVKAFLGFFSYYILAVAFIKRADHYLLVIDVWLGSIMFSCFNGIMQGGKIWGSMWLKDENTISLLAAMALPIAFMLLKMSRSKVKQAFYLLCMAMYVCLNIVAHSRGGALSMGVVAILLWTLSKNKACYLIILIVASIIGVGFLPNYFIEEMKTLEQGTEEGTAADRIYLWGICFEMFADHPLLGVGPSNYTYYFSSYEKGRRYTLGARRPPHTTPLQWLAEMGLVGSLILLLLLLSMYANWRSVQRMYVKWQERPPDSNGAFFPLMANAVGIATVAFWFGSIFLSLMPYPFFWCLPYFSEALKKMAFTHTAKETKGGGEVSPGKQQGKAVFAG